MGHLNPHQFQYNINECTCSTLRILSTSVIAIITDKKTIEGNMWERVHCKNKIVKITNLLVSTVARNSEIVI